MEMLRTDSQMTVSPDSHVSQNYTIKGIQLTECLSTDIEKGGYSELQQDTDSDDSKIKKDITTAVAYNAAMFETVVTEQVSEGIVHFSSCPATNNVPDEEAAAYNDNTNNDEEQELTTAAKKKGKKLKKKSEKRMAFDGRKVVFVTEFTQTDWNWKDKAEKSGKVTVISSFIDKASTSSRSTALRSALVKSDSRQSLGLSQSEADSRQATWTVTDLSPFSLVPDDEFGLPIVEISSDSDSSDAESYHRPPDFKHHLPAVGPPQILRYIPESDTPEKKPEPTIRSLDDEHRLQTSKELLPYEQGIPAEIFSGPCEFCGMDIKPFPSLDQQLSQPPESLYCCEDYQDFVEFVMSVATRLEEVVTKKSQQISVKVHSHHASVEERQMAKEKVMQRMRERELERKQQEASELQAASYKYSQIQEEIIRHDNYAMDEVDTVQPEENGKDTDNVASEEGKRNAAQEGGEVIGGSDAGGNGTKGAGRGVQRRKGKEGGRGAPGPAEEKENHLGGVRGRGGLRPHNFSLGAAQGSYSSFGPLNIEAARQMKTINYQLSSQRCMEEGWTLRAPSPMDNDDVETEVFIPEPLHPAMIASGKLQDRPLIEKYYPSGSKFLTIFPDGSGNVFYPSGRLSILIISISLGQNMYVVLDDHEQPAILGMFEPGGCGFCCFANGKVRLTYDQIGGLELVDTGARKRVWSWKDQERHVHVPPFQPIVFGINSYLGLRFMAQENVALTLTGRKRSCRFNVGARLKVVTEEHIQIRGVEEYQLFINEHKVKVDTILNKISNLLKFPNSPKVDRILPPLSISARKQKVDKMKKASLVALSELKSRKAVKHTRFPPVSVN